MTDQDEIIEYEVPDDATYGDFEITKIGFNTELNRVFVIYEDDELVEGWDQLIFPDCTVDSQGRPVLNTENLPAGVMSPEEAQDEDSPNTPGKQSARELYATLEEVGIVIPN